MQSDQVDVIVVGAGNAALCSALAASDAGASVLVFERAPYPERGGNTAFTAGAMRFAYNSAAEILELVSELSPAQVAETDFGSYSEEQFLDDMAMVTEYRTDPTLAAMIVGESFTTLNWMRSKGVRFMPIYGRQAFKIDGRFRFWGGLTLEAWGGGPGLIDALSKAAGRVGIEIRYRSAVKELLSESGRVVGVRVRDGERSYEAYASSVVLASGGFEANAEWRTRYLGPGWDLAKVRGSRFNTGDGIRMALDIGAMSWGQWSGAHAVGWDLNAPPFGDLSVGDGFQKHSYPFGIMVNADGQRFVDEGADFRNYTYAKYGRIILSQPGQFCWQVFDQKVTPLLRDEYRIREVTKVRADTLEKLVQKMDGVNARRFLDTIADFNNAVRTEVPFDPNVRDGRGTTGLAIPKSNWANTLDAPPFEAYAVTCGITFTFGGLRITPDGQVVNTEEAAIPGLYACGELVGGIFYFNYPGGTGLTSGAVIGRLAGTNAARAAVATDRASRALRPPESQDAATGRVSA
jgi:tricarballylate dehydrogenase